MDSPNGDRPWALSRRGTADRLDQAHGQDELLRPYVDRYLEALPHVWSELSPQLARALTLHLFPVTLIDNAVYERVGAYLERQDLPAAMRRIVLEQHDDLRRALHAQNAQHAQAGR